MPEPRKICVVTGTRAEYGLLYWLMKEIEADPALALQLIVTGTHLEARFGNTVDAIEKDDFSVDARVPLGLEDDTPAGVTAAAAAALNGIGKALADLQPDLVVVLGDRYEILAAATAAVIARVPIAHIHGGELTEGAIDDAIRHAITKLSALHFAAAEPYRRRIIQMGENPDTVFAVGAPGLDHLARTELMDATTIAVELGIAAGEKYFLITLHPTTLSTGAAEAEIDALLKALDAHPETIAVFTGVNADSGRDAIAARIDSYVVEHPDRARMFTSLGQRRYLSAMKHCAAVVGNSSSGIIEAPAFDVPTVNIGPRQHGRLRAPSIIDCDADAQSVAGAIARVLDPEFRKAARSAEKPYGMPGASAKIAAVLGDVDITAVQRKSFYDIAEHRAAS
ncbi:MAG: UDP-N-acetylglucosamine 2-epimerase [Rhodospirillales bacterium]